MKKATVTYHAPAGDAKMIEESGVTLMDGKPDDIICTEERVEQLKTNQYFTVGKVVDYQEPPKEKSKDADAPKDDGKKDEGKTHR